MEYYLSMRKNEVLIFATTWMNFKNMVQYPTTAPKNPSLGPQRLLGSLS